MIGKLNRSGVKLEYEVTGAGPAIVFLHGWASSRMCWHSVVDLLKKDFCCITLDLRGHGNSRLTGNGHADVMSMADDVAALLKKLEADPVLLVAHSMGGMVAFSYIRRYGCARLAGLVLLDISPKITSDASWSYGEDQNSFDEVELLRDEIQLRENTARFVFDFTCRFNERLMAARDLLRNAVDCHMMGIAEPEALVEAWHSVGTADCRDVIPKINVPVLYLIPEIAMFPAEIVDYYREESAAEVQKSVIPNSRHLAMQDNPSSVADAVKQFALNIDLGAGSSVES